MKLNFNNSILNSSTFLSYLYDNNHITYHDYDKYVENNQSLWNLKYIKMIDLATIHEINIYPYIYILEIVGKERLEAFKRYFFILVSKNEMLCIENPEHRDIIDVATLSLEHLVAFIITCQYFFL